MKTTIDAAGRLVIPSDLRREAGLVAGAPLEVRLEDGAVIIEPAATPVKFERRGRFLVARPAQPVPPLRERDVQETRERLSAGRGRVRAPKKG
jgi:AbrB family looped-hinge helix DNA binding protein